MRSLLWRLILLSPLLLLVVLFALSNPESVRLGLWPTNLLVQAPLSLLMLAAMGIAFLLGALTTWVVGLGTRLRARRAEAAAAALRTELQALQARLARAEQPPGATILPPQRAAIEHRP
ncbi:MAG: LapA family protein [Acetobacteraceae bacterium]|nr:LapA family protein [Acetobacteraceae bacterium]